MALEEDLAESGTPSPAASSSQVYRATRPHASVNLRCPVCLDTINDQPSASWCRDPFCFYCMVEWFHRRMEGLIRQLPFPHIFHMVGDSNSEVYSIGESINSASHTQGGEAGPQSAERWWYHSSRCQHHKSYSRSHGGSRGGSRGSRAQEKSQSRDPRRHHDGRGRVQQAQGYNHSSSGRRQQNRAQNTACDEVQAPRTKRPVRAFSRRRKPRQQEYQVSFIEPKAARSRSRQRSRSTASQTLREHLRKMERDEGQALRHDWYIRASSGRSRHQQRGCQVSYRELQVTRNQTPGRFHSRLPLKENPRRMKRYERQPLRTEQGICASPRRSERLQQGHQASFIEPQVTRSQFRGRSRSTRRQTLRQNLRRMEHDEGRALRPEQDIPSSSGWSEHHHRGPRLLSLNQRCQGTDSRGGPQPCRTQAW